MSFRNGSERDAAAARSTAGQWRLFAGVILGEKVIVGLLCVVVLVRGHLAGFPWRNALLSDLLITLCALLVAAFLVRRSRVIGTARLVLLGVIVASIGLPLYTYFRIDDTKIGGADVIATPLASRRIPTIAPTPTPTAPGIPMPGRLLPSPPPVTPTPFGGSNLPASVAPRVPTPSEPPPPPTATPRPQGRTYYIRMTGADTNDGTTPDTAWRSFAAISKGQVPGGATVLAEVGGVWTETIRVQADNLHFGVFGRGPKPKIIAPDGQYAFDGNDRAGTQIDGYEFTSTTRRGGEWGIVVVAYGDYIVRNAVVHGADGWMFTARGPRGLVENCEFYDSGGSGDTSSVSVGGYEGADIAPETDMTTFRNNYVHDTGYRAIGTWGTGVLIEGNRVERWSMQGIRGSATQAPAGIYIASRYRGVVIVRQNTLVGTGSERAIWVDTGPQERTIVESNSIVDAFQCFWAEKTDNVVFQGNVCENPRDNGVTWGDGRGGPDTRPPALNGLIINNTFIGSPPRSGWIRIYPDSTAEGRDNSFIKQR